MGAGELFSKILSSAELKEALNSIIKVLTGSHEKNIGSNPISFLRGFFGGRLAFTSSTPHVVNTIFVVLVGLLAGGGVSLLMFRSLGASARMSLRLSQTRALIDSSLQTSSCTHT